MMFLAINYWPRSKLRKPDHTLFKSRENKFSRVSKWNQRWEKKSATSSSGVFLLFWQKYVCREFVAHQHLHRRGKLKLAKQIRCHRAENAIFHLYPLLISKGGTTGSLKMVYSGRTSVRSWERRGGMCVSGVLGGLWNKNYSCFPSREDGCHGCCCCCSGPERSACSL